MKRPNPYDKILQPMHGLLYLEELGGHLSKDSKLSSAVKEGLSVSQIILAIWQLPYQR